MDLKMFFRKVRQLEAEMTEPHVVISSRETPDGGRAGTLSEVARALAARLIADGKAELASSEAANEFRARAADLKRLADQAALASRIQVTVVSESEARASKSGARSVKA